MPIILNSYSRLKSVEHMDDDETESEFSSEEDYLSESDMDADAEYSYHAEDDDDDMDFDADSLLGDTDCLDHDDSEPDRSSSPTSTFSRASSTVSSASSIPPEPSLQSSSSPPSSDSSRTKVVLHQLVAVFIIYLKFAVLAILVYCVALWYALNFTDLDAELEGKSSTVSKSPDDIDTCPAGLVA